MSCWITNGVVHKGHLQKTCSSYKKVCFCICYQTTLLSIITCITAEIIGHSYLLNYLLTKCYPSCLLVFTNVSCEILCFLLWYSLQMGIVNQCFRWIRILSFCSKTVLDRYVSSRQIAVPKIYVYMYVCIGCGRSFHCYLI